MSIFTSADQASPFAVRLTEGPVNGDWALQATAGNDAGCSLVFFGTVREDGRQGTVTHLFYEAYPQMVASELEAIANEIFAEFEVLRIAVEHSVGTVPLGQCSVAVAIAAAHRKQVFDASARLMDELKARVPIWKKELYQDGSEWLGRGS
ncbi:MAG: molybdenum cofactor biosynthesis protein MoaE [Planctomycetes bacterium]|nr:molybdenum cofactor biosynthesis protein MoaE [Planctomycetota bacterium]MCP4772491.1 molybdenum cofactor biosynthesis protein MoaE [Planctomycetota bacterium]MCP4860116.1 molybdenum cofactor biosynthesis protein MoaE [Planctomycetota bacterium]